MSDVTAPWYPPKGSYVCVKTRGIGAWLVRVGTRSWADHAFIVVDDRGGIVEAMPGGVRKGHITEYSGRRTAVCTEGTAAQRDRVVWAALGMVGIPYDDLDLVDIGLECVGIRWRWLQRAVERSRSVICSQAVAVCGRSAKLDWSCGQELLCDVTPAMLASRIVGLPE